MKLSKSLLSGRWGIEREALRVDAEGSLSTQPHPFAPDQRQLTVDFAEAQPELITAVHETPDGALDELADLQQRLLDAVPHETLWPFSLPGVWHGNDDIQIARFGDDPGWQQQREYRQALAQNHGKARQVISGIHVNYSFGAAHPGGDYFALIRNALRYRPILIFLLAASPWLEDRLFADLATHRSASVRAASRFYRSQTASVRQGPLGYGLDPDVEATIDVRFDSLQEYLDKLDRALQPRLGDAPVLRHEREFYTAIRPKAASSKKGEMRETLRQRGVGYLEFRFFDIDPFAPVGIAEDTLRFFELFVAACAVLPSPHLTPEEQRRLSSIERDMTLRGLAPDIHMTPALQQLAKQLFPLLEALADLATVDHRRVVARFRRQLAGEALRPIARLHARWTQKLTTPLAWGLARAQLHRAWNSLELSTRLLIRKADMRGAEVTLLDSHDNFVALSWDDKTEYVKQATRTSADPYVSALIMENKLVTKKLLQAADLRVPYGQSFVRLDDALAARSDFAGRKVVVKPNSTNFGDGVSILEINASAADWQTAVQTALALDQRVLIEEFAPGLEFRFLVIDGKTRAVLHRVPANVTGDGTHTIGELVETKNKHPWRGHGYRKPLEKIRLEQTELEFLAAQGLDPTSIPDAGHTVFLRENSNISTGGDSIDFTDTMPQVYRHRAEAATAAVHAKICGLDMILPDWRDSSSSAVSTILELNFNPALHIHDFPADGINRAVEDYVLDLLGLQDDAAATPVHKLVAACCC